MAGTDRADHHASRQPVLFRKVVVVDPVDAQRAFLHHARVFIELARAVYVCNDERAAAKKSINLRLGSRLVEEKSYKQYR